MVDFGIVETIGYVLIVHNLGHEVMDRELHVGRGYGQCLSHIRYFYFFVHKPSGALDMFLLSALRRGLQRLVSLADCFAQLVSIAGSSDYVVQRGSYIATKCEPRTVVAFA